jgi:hypothetical protein
MGYGNVKLTEAVNKNTCYKQDKTSGLLDMDVINLQGL